MQMHRGHQTFFWPQSYFTPFCDVVLRFESLKRDFDGLMAKVGCPLRLPEQRKKARGNRLLPLLAEAPEVPPVQLLTKTGNRRVTSRTACYR